MREIPSKLAAPVARVAVDQHDGERHNTPLWDQQGAMGKGLMLEFDSTWCSLARGRLHIIQAYNSCPAYYCHAPLLEQIHLSSRSDQSKAREERGEASRRRHRGEAAYQRAAQMWAVTRCRKNRTRPWLLHATEPATTSNGCWKMRIAQNAIIANAPAIQGAWRADKARM